MIPNSVLCRNYVDLRVELRRYVEAWYIQDGEQESLFILGTSDTNGNMNNNLIAVAVLLDIFIKISRRTA